MDEHEARIGIFVCECGGNIGDVIDVKSVCDAVKGWEKVVVARQDRYLCSKPAQDMIVDEIKLHKINRVVVASCTPRMHLTTFQGVLERAGLNPYLLEFVNIREQCSWVHGPHRSEDATRKAISLIRGGYERSFELEPLQMISEECSRDILVIGAGIAGMVSSLELEHQGFNVHLVDRQPSIGGHMAKLTKVFPTLDCAQCILTPRMAEVGGRKNIRLLMHSEIREVKGPPGNYRVKVFTKPRGVDIETCRGCGACSRVCPVSCPDAFNEYRSERKAVYLPFPQAVPFAYAIDFDYCTKCGKCESLCPSQAIDLDDRGKIVDLNVGSIILATGYELFEAERIREYGYGKYKDVITMMELERLTSLFGPTGGKIVRFSDGGGVRRLAIVLCAGSRDTNRYIPYCSRICCMYALKQAVLLKEQFNIDVWVFYTDLRAAGRGYEELYWRAQRDGVIFVRGKVAEVWANRTTNKLVVKAEDTLTENVMEEEFDLVSLAVPMVPPKGLDAFARGMSLALGEDGFIQEKHVKLDPVNTLLTGVFACGCALGPKDVRDTVSDALGAAAKAASFLKTGRVTTSPEKSFIKPELCNECKRCIEICPSNAITLTHGNASIDPFLCNGCGACLPECPTGAIDFKNSTERQIASTLRGILRDKKQNEVRVVNFVEGTIAYTGVDFLGLDRAKYPIEMRIIKVPSTAFISLRHLLYAFALGANGIVMLEGRHDIDERFTRSRIDSLKSGLDALGIDSMRLWYSLVELPAYKNIAEIFNLHINTVKELGPIEKEAEAAKRKLGI